uniref:Uncharacterized protein n=1 Tax=Anguilla anguilla TaxID=7936 RepID=A0A0E9R8Q1_ANGAN
MYVALGRHLFAQKFRILYKVIIYTLIDFLNITNTAKILT